MRADVNVVYRDIDASESLNSVISKKLQKLNRLSRRLQRCRIVLNSPHRHHHKGKLYQASLELDVKGLPVTVRQRHTSIYGAVNEVFLTAERKLKKLAGKHRNIRHSYTPRTLDTQLWVNKKPVNECVVQDKQAAVG